MPRYCLVAALALICGAGLSLPAQAATMTRSADFDRWNYPFNASPGQRASAPVFGAAGETGFDDFDGQFLLGFNTEAAGLAKTLPAGKEYKLTSVKVQVTHATGTLVYDPTFDNYRSRLDPSDPNYVADSDAGRPVEIYGAGLRGGFTQFGFGPTVPGGTTFEEGDIFAFADPTLERVRNAFAYDPTYGDVSNVLTDGLLDATSWGVGTVDGLAPGAVVPQGTPGQSGGTTFTIDVNLTTPGVEQYLLDGIANGGLFFTVVSLHDSPQGGSTNPNFHTRDNFDPAKIAPALILEYEVVPEPAALSLVAAAGLALMVAGGAKRLRACR